MYEPVPTQNIFATAVRCADCAEAPCMRACPEQVDLRALFQFIADQTPLPVAWRIAEREAEAFADEAIERSFTESDLS